MRYYIVYNGQQVGPMSREQLLAYGLKPESQVWADGMPQWVPAYTVPELMEIMPPAGAPDAPTTAPGCATPPTAPAAAPETSGKRVTAGVLAILLGGLGIHYFIVNKIPAGLITILLTFVTCGLWPILTFVQGILMLTMTDQQFDEKYVNSQSTFPLF